YNAYKVQMFDKINFQCARRLENLGLSFMIAPDPLFSSITRDCVKNGRDISQDGARYIFHMILVTGLADTVDSLAAIKKMVYEEKKVTMEELITALKDNWVGHERLRAMMQNKVPKFGNDDDYVDEIAVQLLKDFEECVQSWYGKHEKVLFPCGVGTFENYAVLGRDTAATPNGRRNWEALAPNYSPVAGADLNGPTSVMKSISKPDLKRYYAGTPVDISVNSNEFKGEAGVIRLKDLIESFCDLGGQIMTITSTNVEDLKDAKIHPEKHKDLRVRMGGLSAYFIAMAPIQQDNIIKRFSR
ncbi:MAG: pyruvate formate lyase family protein, partial [Lachnospiraceae bacterium]|nr:pyruvate formate lyase family protein [Lachnospiraceae bacterium]